MGGSKPVAVSEGPFELDADAASALPIQVRDDFFDHEDLPRAYRSLREIGRVPQGLFFCELERVDRHRWGDPGAVDPFVPYFGDLVSFLFDFLVALTESLGCSRAGPGWLELGVGCNGHVHDDVQLHMETCGGPHLPDAKPRPDFCTIFHVGPEGWCWGGDSHFAPQLPLPPTIEAAQRRSLPADGASALAPEWVHVSPRPNRLVVFDGRVPHGLGPITPGVDPSRPQVNLVVNLWCQRVPLAVREGDVALVSPSEFRALTGAHDGDSDVFGDLVRRYDDEQILALVRVSRRLYDCAQGDDTR